MKGSTHFGTEGGFPHSLEQRVRRMSEEARRAAQARRRQTNVTGTVGALVAFACIMSLTAVTRLGHQLDTDAVAQIGRAELVAHLPATRAAVQEELEREAPKIVRSSLDGLLELMPQVGRMATVGLHAQLFEMNTEFEERIVRLMAESIRATSERLASAWPELSDAERIERLVAEVAADFNAVFAEAIEALYPSYDLEITKLKARLVMLRDADEAMLSEEDQLQREIIETMLRLILRDGVTVQNRQG